MYVLTEFNGSEPNPLWIDRLGKSDVDLGPGAEGPCSIVYQKLYATLRRYLLKMM